MQRDGLELHLAAAHAAVGKDILNEAVHPRAAADDSLQVVPGIIVKAAG